MTERTGLKVQESYTLIEFAALAGVSAKRLREVLRSAVITSRRVGGRHRIFIADIEARIPELWASVLICVRVRTASSPT